MGPVLFFSVSRLKKRTGPYFPVPIFQIIILGICFVIATVASTVILSKGLLQIKKFSNEVISVTGSAEKEIVSDYIVWKAEFSRRDAELKAA